MHNLNKNEIIILSARNSTISGFNNLIVDDTVKKYSSKLHMPINKNWFKRIYSLPSIHKNYKKIDEFIGLKEDFIFYTPHLIAAFNQVIATNQHCIQINIIEDGTVSYIWEQTLKKTPTIKSFILNLLYKNRVPSVQHFDINSFKKNTDTIYYTLSDLAFIGKRNRVIVPIESETPTIPDDSVIFVMDAAYDQNYISENEFVTSLNCFISDINNYKDIYIKFHPSQRQKVIDQTLSILKKKLNVIILPEDTVLEQEFLIQRKDKLRVYGNISTLLIYAKAGNNYAKSYVSLLAYYQKQMQEVFVLYNKLGIQIHKL